MSILKPDGSTLTSTAVFSFGKYIGTQTLPTTGTYAIFIDPNSPMVEALQSGFS